MGSSHNITGEKTCNQRPRSNQFAFVKVYANTRLSDDRQNFPQKRRRNTSTSSWRQREVDQGPNHLLFRATGGGSSSIIVVLVVPVVFVVGEVVVSEVVVQGPESFIAEAESIAPARGLHDDTWNSTCSTFFLAPLKTKLYSMPVLGKEKQ
eukprot:GHVT01025819.1.p1 GENE.GHVT01025819.1~~GHVT01025819.1.p1  ORF type:complete len:151 (-),score=4.33 GHVT01025819.1:300-752(-)